MLTRHAREDQQPVTDPRVASLLEAAAAPVEPGPAPGEEAVLTAFRTSSGRADGWRSRMHAPTSPLKTLAVAATSAGLLLTGGFTAAAAGELPGAAQDTARDMLAHINVVVPGADEHSAGRADTRGRSDDAPAGGEADAADTESEPARHGDLVSELARTTDKEGREKGKAISEAASVKGQEHRHVSAGTRADGGQSADHARVETPNGGGTGTADDASADNGRASSTHGTGTAETASGGRSAAGSSDHRP